jgi:hypothetical protein
MFRQITPNGDVLRSPATDGNLSAQIDDEEKLVRVKQNNKATVSNFVVSIIVSFIIPFVVVLLTNLVFRIEYSIKAQSLLNLMQQRLPPSCKLLPLLPLNPKRKLLPQRQQPCIRS